ncbi:hypothetical protein GCM10020295_37070 [Streptomyces cinereospinus]
MTVPALSSPGPGEVARGDAVERPFGRGEVGGRGRGRGRCVEHGVNPFVDLGLFPSRRTFPWTAPWSQEGCAWFASAVGELVAPEPGDQTDGPVTAERPARGSQ